MQQKYTRNCFFVFAFGFRILNVFFGNNLVLYHLLRDAVPGQHVRVAVAFQQKSGVANLTEKRRTALGVDLVDFAVVPPGVAEGRKVFAARQAPNFSVVKFYKSELRPTRLKVCKSIKNLVGNELWFERVSQNPAKAKRFCAS